MFIAAAPTELSAMAARFDDPPENTASDDGIIPPDIAFPANTVPLSVVPIVVPDTVTIFVDKPILVVIGKLSLDYFL